MSLVGVSMTNPGYGSVLTQSISVSAGDRIVICAIQSSSVSWSSASDTDGNTYTLLATGGTVNQAVFSATAANSGTITVTLTLSSARTGKAAFIWTVPPSTYANFAYETSTTSSTDQTCGSITTTAGQIVIATNVNSNATHYVGTGYTASINDSLYAYFSQAKITAGGTDTGAHTASTARSSQYNYIVSFTQKTPLNTSIPTLTIDPTSFSGTVGTWDSQGNGTLTYQWELRDADDDSVVASGSTSTISGSGSYSGDYYLWVRASNDGGYDSAEDSVSATETASGGGTDNLTANGVSTGAPSVGAPALGQVHVLTATSVATGAPSVSSPSLGQIHSLAASSVATGAPSVGSPALGQTHALTASSVSSGTPSVGSPALGQTHALSATAITSGSPSVASPSLGQIHVLSATEVATGTPTVGTPALDSSSGVDDLTANGVTTGAPTVGSPALGQVHALIADGVSAGAPSVVSPALGQLHALVASAVASGAPSVGSPALGQVHVLVASGVSTGNPSVGRPSLNGPSFRPWFAQANVSVGL